MLNPKHVKNEIKQEKQIGKIEVLFCFPNFVTSLPNFITTVSEIFLSLSYQ